MTRLSALAYACAVVSAGVLSASSALADVPNGAELVRMLGPRAEATLAPKSGRIGALVTLAPGETAAALGLSPLVPGFARLHGSASDILAFADAHPGVHLEVAPPLHRLMNHAGLWINAVSARAQKNVDGTGVLVGVADTGLDVTHPDLRDAQGHSRIAWMLDLSLKPVGLYPDLEERFGVKDSSGNLVAGAVLQGTDIDKLIAAKGATPQDEVGHGTHVTSIAAGNGGSAAVYVGVAPKATILFARITRDSADSIENDDLVTGTAFLFDRADNMKKPVAVNLSLGSDFGPHDGSMAWEQYLASFVGPSQPGHVLAVAAGNSGSITDPPIVHQNVFVTHGASIRVPITTIGATSGQTQVWVAMRAGASINVGLDGPDGQWIGPVTDGHSNSKNASGYTAGVINGSTVSGSPVPASSHGAVVVWSGAWPAGVYYVTLEGAGTVDLYIQADGDAIGADGSGTGFAYGVREGTVILPATNASLLAVGCTVNRTEWTSVDRSVVGLQVPLLDGPGSLPDFSGNTRPLTNGEVCWFSSAGPTLTGVPKPEISAPGGIVIAAMSKQALPGGLNSIFTNPSCPVSQGGGPPDPRCLEVDSTHAVAVGTSMSAPQVAGTAALLFQRDPTLTQDQIVALLQAGAHQFRSGPSEFEDQGGPGELDVLGAIDALEQMNDPVTYLPGACDATCKNWLTLSSDHVTADGSTPLVAIVELRTADGQHRADLFDLARLVPVVKVDGVPLLPLPQMIRKAPGVWFFTVNPPAGLGGNGMTLGATFDGVDIVPEKTLPIATDTWTASYSSSVSGSCALGQSTEGDARVPVGMLAALVVTLRKRRRRA